MQKHGALVSYMPRYSSGEAKLKLTLVSLFVVAAVLLIAVKIWLVTRGFDNHNIKQEIYQKESLPFTEKNGKESPTELQTKLQAELPTELQTKLQAELPTDLPTELPTEVQTELPTDVLTELPTDLQAELPTNLLTELPTNLQAELPTNLLTELPTEVQAELPTDLLTELPKELTTEFPTKLPRELLTELPAEFPTEFPTEQSEWNLQIPHYFQKFIPVHYPNNKDYVMVPKADFKGFGDYTSWEVIPHDLTLVTSRCDRMKDLCKAFSVDLQDETSRVFVKGQVGVPQVTPRQTLFIKKSYVGTYLKALAFNLMCVQTNLTTSTDKRCKLPKIDPWAKDIIHIVPTLPPRKCNEEEVYTELIYKTLRLRNDRRNDPNFIYALAQPILRGDHDDIRSFGQSRRLTTENPSFTIDSDLWRVKTFIKDNLPIETFHLSVVEKPEVLQRMLSDDAPLDIYILAFDGTSEAHFRRMLPKSYAYLKDTLKAYMVKGISVVGDATLPNVNAMLTGIPLEENKKIQVLNDWPLIYKDLQQLGFATMYSEDDPSIGAFTLTLPGFDAPPTDHYARPLWNSGAYGQCLGGQFQPELQFNYLKSFMKSYKGRRKFGHLHLSDLCHRQLNLISIADHALLAFFESLNQENLLNQSMFLVMGDHGARFGEIRQTYQGKLEERLPMLAVTFPSWFEEKFPEKVANFRHNTAIISSPYDLHATFVNLMNFSKHFNNDTGTIGVSLFERLPEDRQCQDAGITDQWCPCIEWHKIDHTHAQINMSAERIVSWMNHNLAKNFQSRTMCRKIHLSKILDAVQKVPRHSKSGVINRCSYQIRLETLPGNALFEATVDILNNGDYIMNDISRINSYGTQAQCIESIVPSVRKYCYCR